MPARREITVGLDDEGKIQAAHISTEALGRRFCSQLGLKPQIVTWDGTSPMFGKTPSEIEQS